MGVRVPNTNTFSLQDVYNAVNDHANPTGDLSDCFANAVSSYFDPAYDDVSYAPANSLKRFRNYGPSGTPATGTFTIPFESYGYRAIGRCIYVSPNGGNLYILIQVKYPTADVFQLVRFTMLNGDLSTVQYHSERNVGSPTNSFRALRFSASGDRFYLLDETNLTSTTHTARIRTWVLSTNWDITNVTSSYESTPIPDDGNTFAYYFDQMAFTEDGYTLVLYNKRINNQFLDFINLTNSTIIPSGTINSSADALYGDVDIGNIIVGFGVFEETFSPGKTVLGIINASDNFELGEIRIDENPWYAPYSYSSIFIVSPFPSRHYSDSYSTPGLGYTYILEENLNTSDPIEPRVYLKVM